MFKMIGLSLVFLTSSFASAETVFVKDKPTAVIKTNEAMRSEKPVWSCQMTYAGPKGNPNVVKGSAQIFASSPGSPLDEPGIELANGGKLYRCKSVQYDKTKARFASADL